MAVISELYRGLIYAGDTPLESTLVVEQTGPLQLTIRAGHLQTTGQARIVHKRQLRQGQIDQLLADDLAEEMPSIKARKIPVSEFSQAELSDLRRMGKTVRRPSLEQQDVGARQLGLLSGIGSQQFSNDEVVVLERDLDDSKKALGKPVQVPDDRLRIWLNGEKAKRHEITQDFVWDVTVPKSDSLQYWLDVGTDPLGQSGFLVNQIDPMGDPIPPPGWSDLQTVIFPFVMSPGTTELPDMMVLTVVPGWPPDDIDPYVGVI